MPDSLSRRRFFFLAHCPRGTVLLPPAADADASPARDLVGPAEDPSVGP